MNDPRHPLTPAIQEAICSYIRSGGFPVVAAQAAGVPQKVFEWWMKCGKAARPVPLYRDFYEAVCTAQAHARLCAENYAFEHAAITWLKSGPGKETPHMAGWTSPVKARPLPEKVRRLSEDRMQTLITVLLTALKPFPEARAAAADALDAAGLGLDSPGDPVPETPQQEIAVAGTPAARTEASETNTSPVKEEQVAVQPTSATVRPAVRESTAAPGASAAEIKVDQPVAEPAGKVQGSSSEVARNPHGSDIEGQSREQKASIETSENPPRREPSLGEAQREMYWNLLRSG